MTAAVGEGVSRLVSKGNLVNDEESVSTGEIFIVETVLGFVDK